MRLNKLTSAIVQRLSFSSIHQTLYVNSCRSIDIAIRFYWNKCHGTLNMLSARSYWHSRSPATLGYQYRWGGSLPRTILFTEDTPFDPRSPYSASKQVLIIWLCLVWPMACLFYWPTVPITMAPIIFLKNWSLCDFKFSEAGAYLWGRPAVCWGSCRRAVSPWGCLGPAITLGSEKKPTVGQYIVVF